MGVAPFTHAWIAPVDPCQPEVVIDGVLRQARGSTAVARSPQAGAVLDGCPRTDIAAALAFLREHAEASGAEKAFQVAQRHLGDHQGTCTCLSRRYQQFDRVTVEKLAALNEGLGAARWVVDDALAGTERSDVRVADSARFLPRQDAAPSALNPARCQVTWTGTELRYEGTLEGRFAGDFVFVLRPLTSAQERLARKVLLPRVLLRYDPEVADVAEAVLPKEVTPAVATQTLETLSALRRAHDAEYWAALRAVAGSSWPEGLDALRHTVATVLDCTR